jgi:DNA-binding winged helix-turn-helix (wHTH) protein
MLIERGGTIVTREEIRRKLWPNSTIVDFDHSINVAIGILRKALGDSASNPTYIETLARRGYRLLVAVEFLVTTSEIHRPERPSCTLHREPPGSSVKKFPIIAYLEL